MIRYYPDIFVQRKHMQKMENKLGYSGNKKSTDIKSSEKLSKSEMAKDMATELKYIKACKYAKKNSLPAAAKKFNVPLKKLKGEADFYNSVKKPTVNPYGNHIMFGPGFMPRTIGGSAHDLNYPIQWEMKKHQECNQDLNKLQIKYKALVKSAVESGTLTKLPVSPEMTKLMKQIAAVKHTRVYMLGLIRHGLSLADMTDWIYDQCRKNPNTISYWYPPLMKGYDKSNHFFKVPKTKIWTLPIEIAQYLQTDYQETNQVSRDAFNKLVFDAFDLDKNKSYFIKTGVFSGKYEFRNVHCKEPLEMGEYFHAINNFAMQVGASTSVDLCVRQWIPDVEHRPTIYDGMPLRTEFRSFIDFDHNKIIGIVPYWNPIVMDAVLQRQGKHNPAIERDFKVYHANINSMMKEFNQSVPTLHDQLNKLIPKIPMHGKWSLDIMKNGSDFYLIDMAEMKNSALTELLPKYHF